MKFTDLQDNLPVRQSERVNGLYMRGVAISKLDDFEAKTKTTNDILFWFFENIFCDENGEPFEDIKTVDDVKKVDVDVAVMMLEDANKILGVAGKEFEATQLDS